MAETTVLLVASGGLLRVRFDGHHRQLVQLLDNVEMFERVLVEDGKTSALHLVQRMLQFKEPLELVLVALPV